jgi:hypothetical protein
LSAANNILAAGPRRARPCPTTGCEEPYIGDESIIRPPASKNAFITSAHPSRAARSLPTLKVIQVPRPITGSASPVEGIGLVATAGPVGRGLRERGDRPQRSDAQRDPLQHSAAFDRAG